MTNLSSTYFLQQAGLNAAASFNVGLGGTGLALICCFAAWPLTYRLGRRPLMLAGLAVTTISLIAIGACGVPEPTSTLAWLTGGFTYLFIVPYNLTIGPLAFLLITDVPTARLRPKTAVLARSAYIITTLLNVIITNYQINATAWNWRGRAGFFWAASSLLCLVWVFFRMPETKARLATEIDILFNNRVPARQFAKTEVAAVGDTEDVHNAA